jgi:hypothetical protein
MTGIAGSVTPGGITSSGTNSVAHLGHAILARSALVSAESFCKHVGQLRRISGMRSSLNGAFSAAGAAQRRAPREGAAPRDRSTLARAPGAFGGAFGGTFGVGSTLAFGVGSALAFRLGFALDFGLGSALAFGVAFAFTFTFAGGASFATRSFAYPSTFHVFGPG